VENSMGFDSLFVETGMILICGIIFKLFQNGSVKYPAIELPQYDCDIYNSDSCGFEVTNQPFLIAYKYT
jgi:hypothetical protein